MVNKKAHDHRQSIVATMEERREDEDREEQQAAANARQHSSKEVMTGTLNKRVFSIKVASTKKQQSTKGVIVVCETKPQPRRVHKLMEQASTVQDQEEEQRIMRIKAGKDFEIVFQQVKHLVNHTEHTGFDVIAPKVEGEASDELYKPYIRQYVFNLNNAANQLKK